MRSCLTLYPAHQDSRSSSLATASHPPMPCFRRPLDVMPFFKTRSMRVGSADSVHARAVPFRQHMLVPNREACAK
eukprot:3960934-Pleurochrysis_carterae.AAC.1